MLFSMSDYQRFLNIHCDIRSHALSLAIPDERAILSLTETHKNEDVVFI